MLNSEKEIDLCPRQISDGAQNRQSAYSASVVAQSFYEVLGEENSKKKDMWEEEFLKRLEDKQRISNGVRVGEFQGCH